MVPITLTTRFTLGLAVQDTATGFTGTVTAVSIEYPGTARACVEPMTSQMTQADKDEARWFDVSRLVPLT